MTQIPGDGENSPLPAQNSPAAGTPAGMSPNGYPQGNPETYGGEVAPQYLAGYPQPPAYPQPPWPVQAANPVDAPTGSFPPQVYPYTPAPVPPGFTPSPPQNNKPLIWRVALITLAVVAVVAVGVFVGLKLSNTDSSSALKSKTASSVLPKSPKVKPTTSVPADYIKQIDFANAYLPNFSEYSAEKCGETAENDTELPFMKMPDSPDPCWIKMDGGVSEDKFPESIDQGYRHISAGDPVSELGENSSYADGWEEYTHPSGTPYYLADMNGDGYLDAMTVGGNIAEGTFANICILDPADPDHPYCLARWITLGGSQRFDFRGSNEMTRASNDGDIESTFTVTMRDGKPYLTEHALD